MNEFQVEDLLNQHAKQIDAVRSIKPKKTVMWRPVMATGAVAIAVGVFVLIPKNAEAAKIYAMRDAIKGAKSLEIHTFSRVNNLEWHEFLHSIYQDGYSWMNNAIGSGMEFTMKESPTHRLLDYKNVPFVELGTLQSDEEFQQIDPLKDALACLDGNSDKSAYKFSTEKGEIVNGRPTYIIHYSRSDIKRSLTIIVDESTKLPIESYCVDEAQPERNQELTEIRTTYKYNQEFKPDLFEFSTKKHIFDVQKQKQRLQLKWEAAKVEKGLPPVYEATVTHDGTIWLAYGATEKEIKGNLPCEIQAGDQTYKLAMDYPVSSHSINSEFKIRGRQTYFAPFVTSDDLTVRPIRGEVKFAKREKSDSFDLPGKVPAAISIAATMPVEFALEDSRLPDYLPSVGFTREYLSIPTQLWRRIATAREEKGDFNGAIDAFEREEKAWSEFVKYMAYRPMLEEARIYDKLGQADKAKALRDKAAKLKFERLR